MQTVYLATANAHKAGELEEILRTAGLDIHVCSARELGGMPDVEETAPDFEGNARLKAQALRPLAPQGAWVLADDSGLEVDALGGAPGVHSSRYAGPGASDADRNAKLLGALAGVPDAKRTARFRCCVVVLRGDGREFVFNGRCEGRISVSPAGCGGFGYDPLFVPEGYDRSFAELPGEVKNRISHRARALQALAAGWPKPV